MAKSVETKVVEVLDSLQKGVSKLGKEVVKYGPVAVDTTLSVVRINGLANLIPGILSLIIFLIMVLLGVHCFPLKEDSGSFVLGLIISIIGGFISGCFACAVLSDIWIYVQVFNPKLYIAKELVEKILDRS